MLSFKKKLASIDWSILSDCSDANESYEIFFEKFFDIYNNCFPIQNIRNRKPVRFKRPWISNGILKSINVKNKLYKRSLKNPTSKNLKKYKHYKNKLLNIIRHSKKKYYEQLFFSLQGDMKKTWSHINNVLGNKRQSTMPSQMFLDNHKFTSKHNIVNQFNTYFVNVGKKLQNSISNSTQSYESFISYNSPASFFIRPITNNEIIDISSFIKPGKASGPDEISPRVVKESIYCIVQPLCNIYNLSFTTGIVPNKLKIAKIVPLFKKKNPEYIENYRPVALISIFAKLLEKLMHNRLYDFLTIHNILIPVQFGFRKKYSTSLSVINFSDYILQELDKGNFCCGVFMDLSKAFDTIDHHILLKKLFIYGLRGIPLQWFQNYLHERKQYVVVDGVESTHLNVDVGVPQGSVLGPLLFLIYVNDIIKSSNLLQFSLFADDTVVLHSHKNISSLVNTMNEELKLLCEWFKCNKLFLNFDKTKHIIFHSRNRKVINTTPIKMENNVIERTESIDFFLIGILIHESLDWKYHIKNINSKLSRAIGVLSKLKCFLPRNILVYIYNTIMLPHLNYCNEIWGNTYSSHINTLHILQKRALRLITNSKFDSPSLPIFVKLCILPVYDLIKLNILLFMYKFHHDMLPKIFMNMFKTNSSFHSYPTRQNHLLRKPIAHSTKRTHSIRFSGAHEWNSISTDLKSSSTLSRFKTIYKRLVFQKLSTMTE